MSKDSFDRHGYVIFRDVIDQTLVAQAGAHIEWLLEENPDLGPDQLHHELMKNDPFWVGLVGDDRLLDIAEQFIGPNIALFASHYICKPPGSGRQVLWHQDGAYWPLEPMEVVSLWLAVDHSTPENGCLRVIPGSHLLEIAPARDRLDVDNVLGSEIDVDPSQIDEDKARDLVLAPGDVSAHHPNIIHGSNPNKSDVWRRGLTIRYIPTTTLITAEQPFSSAFLLRGEAVEGVNQYQPRPAPRSLPFLSS